MTQYCGLELTWDLLCPFHQVTSSQFKVVHAKKPVVMLLYAGYSQEDGGWSSFVSIRLIKLTGWTDYLFCKIYNFLHYLLWAAQMEWAMAGGVRMRRKRSRSMNDWSRCTHISSLRKGSPPVMQGRASKWQSYTTGSSRSSQPMTRSPQNLSWILCTCFKLLKEVASKGNFAMLFNGKYLPFYSLELICWRI